MSEEVVMKVEYVSCGRPRADLVAALDAVVESFDAILDTDSVKGALEYVAACL